MIRQDKHKLIVYPYAGVKRLYDLPPDPKELNDIASEPGQKERVDEMFRSLQELMVEMDDTVNLVDFFPGDAI